MNLSNKQYKIISYVLFLIFGIIIAILSLTVSYKFENSNIEKHFFHNLNSEINNKIENLRSFIMGTEDTLNAIYSSEILKDYLSDQNSAIKKRNLEELFLTLAKENKKYLQIRFLDSQGNEKVKICRQHHRFPIIVNENKLQNKKHRNYFINTVKIKGSSFYYSNLSLNIENKKIEYPYKPTLRISTPVYIKSNFYGILVINLDMKLFLKNFVYSNHADFYFVDKNNEILSSSNPEYSWSRQLNKTIKFQNIVNLNNKNINRYELKYIIPNNENLLLYVIPKSKKLEDIFLNHIQSSLLILLIVFLIAIPLAYILSMIPSKLNEKLKNSFLELQEKTDLIDKYIIVSTTDIRGRIEYVSKAFLKATEYRKYQILGQKHSLIKDESNRPEFYEKIWNQILNGNIWKGEIKNRTRNGKEIWFEETIVPRKDFKNKEILGFTSIAIDVTDKKRIEKLSVTDQLTQVCNRLKLDEVLEREIYSAHRYNKFLSIVLIDIDKFKEVNDNYGHQVGDSVLVELAKLVQKNIRKSDIFGRWGGEEFLLILPQTNIKSGVALAEKIRSKVEKYQFSVIGNKTASFGVTAISDGDNEDSLIRRADECLYQAKENGRNRVEFKVKLNI